MSASFPAHSVQPTVRHEADCKLEQWTTADGEQLTWRTLINGDHDLTRGMTAGVTEIPVGAGSLIPHRHAADELYLIQSGTAVLVIDDVEHEVRAGTAIFIPGNAWHSLRNPGPDPLRMFYVFPTDTFSEIVYEFPPNTAAPVVS
jgi:mannose-6-phosphate isomerase-like protein (cupin superfamily)